MSGTVSATGQSEPARLFVARTIGIGYAAVLLTFLAADALWLTFAGGPLASGMIGPLLADNVRVAPAAVFYLLYVAGIMIFVVPRARHPGTLWSAAAYGAAFGLFCYGTYDLTNQAVMRVWPWQLTVIDMGWGSFVTGLSAVAGAAVERLGGRRRLIGMSRP